MEDHDAADPPLRTLNVFYQGTTVEMLEETYIKFKKNILPKMKKMQPNFQEPVVEYCEPEQVIDICSYNHYPILDKLSEKQEKSNDDNVQTHQNLNMNLNTEFMKMCLKPHN